MWGFLDISSAPAAEPFSTAEAKSHLQVEHSDDDTLIAMAAKRVEAVEKRAVEAEQKRDAIVSEATTFREQGSAELRSLRASHRKLRAALAKLAGVTLKQG